MGKPSALCLHLLNQNPPTDLDKSGDAQMSEFNNGSAEGESTPEKSLDRRRVLREFVRAGKYAAPVATMLLLNTKGAVAMTSDE